MLTQHLYITLGAETDITIEWLPQYKKVAIVLSYKDAGILLTLPLSKAFSLISKMEINDIPLEELLKRINEAPDWFIPLYNIYMLISSGQIMRLINPLRLQVQLPDDVGEVFMKEVINESTIGMASTLRGLKVKFEDGVLTLTFNFNGESSKL